jgi:hypothetical protein
MARNQERKGVLPQIIVAVVVALLVGGTSPWWWRELFPNNPPVNPTPNPPANITPPPTAPPRNGNEVVVRGGQIRVGCTANPYSIPAGGQVEVNILAFTEQNSPVSSANVLIQSGGGWFSSSGTASEVGQTDPGGAFRTLWRAPNPALPEGKYYGMNVTVTKDGFTEGKCEFRVTMQ